MPNSELYYCVVCKKLEPVSQAHQLFRTGFFRVVHPLGCCVPCREELENMTAVLDGAGVTDSALEITVLNDSTPYGHHNRMFHEMYSSKSYTMTS
ncbi:hypothetical protein ACFOQM_02750 [Paenibacillus sp. GCM10012307]|uniref:Uncharacterized protein n=1 Tax=Paenibacillus roseus TaxID=2798579 RepID=A0A934MJS7_9BACL|nr:hypothetical protein [Paenibacillus roseus]MBJ6360235.1 hypothetical protein [Paenibacillus roseus]